MMLFVLFLGLAAVVFSDEDFERKRLALLNPDLYDGDMLGVLDHERNVLVGERFRWPNARVPYVIDYSMENQKDLLQKAFQHYHDDTCVTFVPRTDEESYIRIFSGQGCYSHVGMRHGPQQSVSLGDGCLYLGTVVYELGHVLGFIHEQSRSDRYDYLTIHLENVIPGNEIQFGKMSPTFNILYNTFDYKSIMIYGNNAFSKNGKPTMVAKTGQKLPFPFEQNGMTDSDIYRVRKMYNF